MNISPDYRILYDENNVILEYHDIREKKKKDGSVEEYEYTDRWFFPTIKIALKSYLQKSLKGSESVETILKRIAEVESQIDQLPITKP